MTNRAIIQARKIDLLLKLISLITSMGSSPTVKKSVASFLVPLYIVVASFISLAAIFYPPIASALMTLRLATDFLQKKICENFYYYEAGF